MKKTLLSVTLGCSLIFSIYSGVVFADEQGDAGLNDSQVAVEAAQNNTTSTSSPGDMTKPEFMFNVNNLSPSENKYDKGTDGNIKFILYNIGTTLLIVIPMLAVLFIVVGGIMMATASMGGKDGQFSKGKTMIVFNITAIALSLLSYSIIQLVAWVLQIR